MLGCISLPLYCLFVKNLQSWPNRLQSCRSFAALLMSGLVPHVGEKVPADHIVVAQTAAKSPYATYSLCETFEL